VSFRHGKGLIWKPRLGFGKPLRLNLTLVFRYTGCDVRLRLSQRLLLLPRLLVKSADEAVSKARRFMLFALFSHVPLTW
jgi:hypothetical protein